MVVICVFAYYWVISFSLILTCMFNTIFDSLHERPISSPIGMDAVIYAAQISSSFFSSLAVAVEEFLDLFIVVDSNSDNSGDDDTSLNSRSLTLGGGEKRIPSGALSAIVLWCDSELA